MLKMLKQGGGSVLDRMRGREEEKSDPLTRTIRDRWVVKSGGSSDQNRLGGL